MKSLSKLSRNPCTKVFARCSVALAVFGLVGFAGCQPEVASAESKVEAGEPAGAGDGVAAPAIEVVELTDEEAGREAAAIESEVSIQAMEGLEVTLWASETFLSDPVALDVDEQGRVYVTQTARHHRSEFDIRDHPDWTTPSIILETVEDRRAFLREELSPERSSENPWLEDFNEDGSRDWRDLTVHKERVTVIEDTSGDGMANRGQLLFEGFHEEVSDVAAGVLAVGEDVYVTVAPDLWRLRDSDGDGWADEKESVVHGFGVHIGFSGHGLSGPIMGPDGRLYWSIGDYGANIVAQDGTRWSYPNTGVVVRANPDGSDFEVFAYGVRNTHEIAFDEYGNLISVDNDGDHAGEHERIVYLVNGSDTGWRTSWQIGKYTDPKNNDYKVWMDEELFKPRFEGQAAYILPPVAAFTAGPSGVAYNPGTALSERWKDFIFVSEFVGTQPGSRITAFKLEEKGAGFELAEEYDVMSGLQPTSLAFGPDGALYFSDWIIGWGMNGKGRIWKMDTPATANSDSRKETKSLLQENFAERSGEALAGLLEHVDMRVRQKAQFELVSRGEDGAEILTATVAKSDHQLARIHALWGLGQRIRAGGEHGETLIGFLTDADAEIRAQAAKVLGDVRYAPAAESLVALLDDEDARVRFFATEALGRIGHEPAVGAIARMLIENDGEDTYLRHGGAIALARIGEAEPLVAFADHESRALRIAAVIALRRMRDPGVAAFLSDEDEYVVTEAARAINDDRSIPEALPALAQILGEARFSEEALLRRAINANLRVGGEEAAARVADYAARADAPEAMRIEALKVLGVWARPSVLDRVDGRHRGVIERDPALVRGIVAAPVEALLRTPASPSIRTAAAETAGRLELESAASTLLEIVRNDDEAQVRAAALDALHDMESEWLDEAVTAALGDPAEEVRGAGLRIAPTLTNGDGQLVEMLANVLAGDSEREQQIALEALGRLQNERAKAVLDSYLDKLLAGSVAPAIQLDLIESVETFGDEILLEKLATYREAKPEGDPLAAYSEALHGGNASLGRRIFEEHPSVSCARCHAIRGAGGEVGPDLTHIAGTLNREGLLQALVDPSARIAPGYGIVSLTLADGERVVGTLLEEGDGFVKVEVGGEAREIAIEHIASREDAPSSMPTMTSVLTERQLRDLVAYLASLK